MKLEKVGDTVISTDGNYSEDTTIRVTAVHANDGTTDTSFTGVVNIAEDGTAIYTAQQQGVLPPNVTISAGGTVTFVAKSLAGPKIPGLNGARPDSAFIKTTNFPVYRGTSLEIEQWVDMGQKHFKSVGPTFDWVESRARDILDHSAGTLATVVSKITSYTIDSTMQDSTGLPAEGEIAEISPNSNTFMLKINPFSAAQRRNGNASDICGHARSKLFTNTFVHEARHAYQLLLSLLDPPNDLDADWLVNNVPIDVSPPNIIVDSTVSRPTCKVDQSPPVTVWRSYKGDSGTNSKDSLLSPDFVRDALEEDAYTFGDANDN
jgi:hypothetical protein